MNYFLFHFLNFVLSTNLIITKVLYSHHLQYMYLGLAPALTAQDKIGDEVTSDSADEGDKLCLLFYGHDNTEVMDLPEPRVPYPETV